MGKFGLLRRDHILAKAAADMLVRIWELNEHNMKDGRFQLRWTGASYSDLVLLEAVDVFHCVLQHELGQLYFMLGFPIMVLLETSSAVEGTAYRACALDLLRYLKECKGVFESPMAHKMGRAAAMAGDKETAVKVSNFFVSQQQVSGCFQEDPEAMDSLDQTAELAVWLRQIQGDLA